MPGAPRAVTSEERPLLYLTYAKPWWVDVYNFDRRRYQPLPHVEHKRSREERASQRASVGAEPLHTVHSNESPPSKRARR